MIKRFQINGITTFRIPDKKEQKIAYLFAKVGKKQAAIPKIAIFEKRHYYTLKMKKRWSNTFSPLWL
jgi:hypothetical protein